jgi:hypothetical protein
VLARGRLVDGWMYRGCSEEAERLDWWWCVCISRAKKTNEQLKKQVPTRAMIISSFATVAAFSFYYKYKLARP